MDTLFARSLDLDRQKETLMREYRSTQEQRNQQSQQGMLQTLQVLFQAQQTEMENLRKNQVAQAEAKAAMGQEVDLEKVPSKIRGDVETGVARGQLKHQTLEDTQAWKERYLGLKDTAAMEAFKKRLGLKTDADMDAADGKGG